MILSPVAAHLPASECAPAPRARVWRSALPSVSCCPCPRHRNTPAPQCACSILIRERAARRRPCCGEGQVFYKLTLKTSECCSARSCANLRSRRGIPSASRSTWGEAVQGVAKIALRPKIATNCAVRRPGHEGVPPGDLVTLCHSPCEAVQLDHAQLRHAASGSVSKTPQQRLSASYVSSRAAHKLGVHSTHDLASCRLTLGHTSSSRTAASQRIPRLSCACLEPPPCNCWTHGRAWAAYRV